MDIYVTLMYKSGFIVALLLIAPVITVQNVIAVDGYWALDAVERNNGGRDDVSTTWNDISDTALAGKTSWKWDNMDCSQTILSRFSWSGIPEIIVPWQPINGMDYPLTVRLEQLNNNNCLSVGSWLKIYYGPPTNISKPMTGMNDGPDVLLGTGDGLVGEKTLAIGGPGYDDRGFAIMVWCKMYQEWYIVQYRYKWIQGGVPQENTKPNDNLEPRDKQVPDLSGAWDKGYLGPCEIRQSGGSLEFINENGQSSSGRFIDSETVIASDWESGLIGHITQNDNRIDWENGTWWER